MEREPGPATRELDPRLLAHAPIALARPARRLPADRQRLGREPFERGDVVLHQLAGLEPREPGDQAQVIVGPPLPVAVLEPAADLAVLDRIRVGRRPAHDRGVGRGLEAPSHPAVVGEVVLDPVGLEREAVEPGHHVHVLGAEALDHGDQVGVEAELEHGLRLGVARQLGVERLVGPVAEAAGARDAQQHVGAAEPALVRERRLGDHVPAGEHRGDRALERAALAALLLEVRDRSALRFEVCEVGALVLEAALGQHLGLGPEEIGRLRTPLGGPAVERGEVPAREVIREVGGGEPQLAGDELHGIAVLGAGPVMTRSTRSAWPRAWGRGLPPRA